MNVREEFTYNSRTGEICFSTDGKSAVVMNKGRHVINFDGQVLSGAVVAWRIYHGEVPEGQTVVLKNELGGLNIYNLKLADESENPSFDMKSYSMQSPPDVNLELTVEIEVVGDDTAAEAEESDELFLSDSSDDATGTVEFSEDSSTPEDPPSDDRPFKIEFDNVSNKWRALVTKNNGKIQSLGLFSKEASAINVSKRSQLEYDRSHKENGFTS
jgi:hypothetical protein